MGCFFFKNGNVVSLPDTSNISSNLYEKQTNTGSITLTYNYKTDIFKKYGFDTCLKLSPPASVSTDTAFMAYSYLTDRNVVYGLGETFSVSMYVYVSSDCNAKFNLKLEHSCAFIDAYKSLENSYLLSDTTKGKVIYVWARYTANSSDGKVYLMFYPNMNTVNTFTTGYYLVTGINIHKGSEIIMPSYDGNQHGIYSIPNSARIDNDCIVFDNFIEC